MKNNLTIILISCCMILIGLSTNNLSAQCSLGNLTTATVQSVCSSEPFEIAFDATPVSDGGFTLTWDNTNTGGTGGTMTIPFSWDGFGGFPISLNSGLNDALQIPFGGVWEFTVEALAADGSICDQTPVITITFLDASDATCSDCSVVDAGVLTSPATQSLCSPSSTFTIDLDGSESPVGGYQLTFDNSSTGGTGGTGGGIFLNIFDTSLPFTYDGDLNGILSGQATPLPPLSGTWELTLFALNGNGGRCDSTTVTTVHFNTEEIVATVDGITDATGADDGTVMISLAGGTAPYTYAWSNGEVSEDLADLAPDDYTVTITDAIGCAVDVTVTVGGLFLDVNRIDGISSFSLSPNPTGGLVKIAMSLAYRNDVQLEVFDVAGRSILSDSRSNSTDVLFDLDLGNFSEGVYFARFVVDGQAFTERIIKSD